MLLVQHRDSIILYIKKTVTFTMIEICLVIICIPLGDGEGRDMSCNHLHPTGGWGRGGLCFCGVSICHDISFPLILRKGVLAIFIKFGMQILFQGIIAVQLSSGLLAFLSKNLVSVRLKEKISIYLNEFLYGGLLGK